MDKKTLHNDKLENIVMQIIAAIDLNYLLAEARRDGYKVSLMCADLERNKYKRNKYKWSSQQYHLSYNYEISSNILYQFISSHTDKIIKINVSSIDDIFPLNRNIIIYVPCGIDPGYIKKEYSSVVEIW